MLHIHFQSNPTLERVLQIRSPEQVGAWWGSRLPKVRFDVAAL